MMSRHQTPFFFCLFEGDESENDLNFLWLATIFAVQKCIIFGKKAFLFHLLSVYMIMTDGNFSQSKTVETA